MASPTLDELRNSLRYADRSRFHKSRCPKCGEMVTNQAMGRKSHMRMHEREKATAQRRLEAEQDG